jgi:hypothetical protein
MSNLVNFNQYIEIQKHKTNNTFVNKEIGIEIENKDEYEIINEIKDTIIEYNSSNENENDLSKVLYIPLKFWFNKTTCLAHPEVYIPNNVININYKFTDINELNNNNSNISIKKISNVSRDGSLFNNTYLHVKLSEEESEAINSDTDIHYNPIYQDPYENMSFINPLYEGDKDIENDVINYEYLYHHLNI